MQSQALDDRILPPPGPGLDGQDHGEGNRRKGIIESTFLRYSHLLRMSGATNLSTLKYEPLPIDVWKREGLSNLHAPFYLVPRRTRLKANTRMEPQLRNLAEKYFPEVSYEHGMAAPNYQDSLHDFAKHSRDWSRTRLLESDLVQKAIDLTLDFLAPAMPIKLFDRQSDMMSVQSLDWSTGAGWPWSSLGRTKRAILEAPRFHVDWSSAMEQLRLGGYAFCSVAPKEEVRDLNKLWLGSIRTFMPFSMDLQVLGASVTFNLSDTIARHWLDIPITMGINMYEGGWDRFIRSCPANMLVQSCDAPKWDGCFHPQFFNICVQIHKAFYESSAHEWIDVLGRCICESPLIFPNGLVCFRYGGMPSGAPTTILWNSFARLFMLCFFIVKVRPDLASLAALRSRVWFRVHGDDGLLAATAQDREWFNAEAITALFASYGWPAAWVPDSETWKSIDQVKYLSHNSVVIDGSYMPVRLSHSKILTALICGADIETPEGWDRNSYLVGRAWQICNTTFPDRAFHVRLSSMLLEYQNSIHLGDKRQEAIGQRKTAHQLLKLFSGRVLQSGDAISGMPLFLAPDLAFF